MKRFCLILLFAALIAIALFAVDPLYCKWCGSSNFGNMQQLLTSPCSKSPTRKHEPYGGAPRRFYICQYCATESSSFTQLVTSLCSKSPRKYHDAYEGVPIGIEKSAYTCKHCAAEYRSFKQLVLSPCSKNPRGYHEAL